MGNVILSWDLGGHDNAAARPIYDENGKLVRIDDLYLDGDKNKVVNTKVIYKGEVFNYFKASPKYFNDKFQSGEVTVTRRELMKLHIANIYNNVIKYNANISKIDNILLIVGCPSSEEWTSEPNRRAYEKLIKEAIGDSRVRVRVVPESRAAMFSALADGKGRMISAREGACVFDLGSTTMDFTYLKTGERCIEFSCKLGAREIEKALRKMMWNKAVEQALKKGQELVSATNYAKLEEHLCKMKENYFSGNLDEDIDTFTYKFKTNQGKNLPIMLQIDDDTMQKALDEEISLEINHEMLEGGWKACCKKFFERCKKELEKNKQSVKEIVLTGGASRMKFAKEIAQEVFPKGSYNVTCATNPSFSVSRGLVWVALVDELQEEIVSIVTKAVSGSNVAKVSELKDELKSKMGEMIYQTVLSPINDWAEASRDESLNDLEKRMTEAMNKKKLTIQTTARNEVTTWSNNLMEEIRKQLEAEIQKSFGPALGQKMQMPENKWKALSQYLNNIGVDVNNIVNSIDVNSFLRTIMMWVIAIAYAVVGAILFSAIGGIIGFVIGALLADEISDEDRQKSRKKSTREKVKKEMKKDDKKTKILEECNTQIDNAIDTQITSDSIKKDIETIVRKAYEVTTLKFAI